MKLMLRNSDFVAALALAAGLSTLSAKAQTGIPAPPASDAERPAVTEKFGDEIRETVREQVLADVELAIREELGSER